MIRGRTTDDSGAALVKEFEKPAKRERGKWHLPGEDAKRWRADARAAFGQEAALMCFPPAWCGSSRSWPLTGAGLMSASRAYPDELEELAQTGTQDATG